MIKWLIGIAVFVVLTMTTLVILAALTGLADIPCQDGIWDEARHSCVQTAS